MFVRCWAPWVLLCAVASTACPAREPFCDTLPPATHHRPPASPPQAAPGAACSCDRCQSKQRRIVICHDEPQDALPQYGPEAYPSAAPAGAFLAPPQAGTTIEAGTTVGIRGLAIRIPEMRLALPTLELPRLQRFHQDKHLELDRAVAPYRALPYQGVGATAVSYAARQTAVPQSAPEQPSDASPQAAPDDAIARCEELKQALVQKNAELQAKICQLDAMMAHLAATAAAPACPPAVAPQPPAPAVCPPAQHLPAPVQLPKPVEVLPCPVPELEYGSSADGELLSPISELPLHQLPAPVGGNQIQRASHVQAAQARPIRLPPIHTGGKVGRAPTAAFR